MDLSPLKSALSLRQKFNVDVLWNVASLAVLGVAGVVINGVIAVSQGAAALGIFNQVFAAYIMLSQIAVGGIHFSVLKEVSHHQDDRQRCADITISALVLGTGIAVVVCAIAYLLRHWVGSLLDSPGVAEGLALAVPGLLFFSLNKILLNVLNGLSFMRAFAVFQALRYLFILAAVWAIVWAGWPAERLALSLTVSEVLLLLLLLAYLSLAVFPLKLSSRVQRWFGAHLSYGFRGFFSGLLTEMNTRVDVLLLGYFCDDAAVGVYSFAAILAEGFAQLPLVVRRNMDPIIGRYFAEHDRKRMEEIAHRVKKVTYLAMGLVAVAAVGLYPVGLKMILAEPAFASSSVVFAILMAGIAVNSGYRPFLGIMLQGGRPGAHTFFVSAIVLSNAILNILLIPLLGVYGSAVATATAYGLEAVLIVVCAKKLFGVTL